MIETILKVCISIIVFEVFKIITPSGNLSKFTESIYSIILIIMVFNIVAGFDKIPKINFNIKNSDINYNETYKEDVLIEYQARIINLIEENCKVKAHVVFDETSIKSVLFDENPGVSSINYLVNELGVDRNDIIIRKNQ